MKTDVWETSEETERKKNQNRRESGGQSEDVSIGSASDARRKGADEARRS